MDAALCAVVESLLLLIQSWLLIGPCSSAAAAGVAVAEPAAAHRHVQHDQGGVPGGGEYLVLNNH